MTAIEKLKQLAEVLHIGFYATPANLLEAIIRELTNPETGYYTIQFQDEKQYGLKWFDYGPIGEQNKTTNLELLKNKLLNDPAIQESIQEGVKFRIALINRIETEIKLNPPVTYATDKLKWD